MKSHRLGNYIWKLQNYLEDLKSPNEEDWKKIATGFANKYNFPNYIGAVDEKHVVMQVCLNRNYIQALYKKERLK